MSDKFTQKDVPRLQKDLEGWELEVKVQAFNLELAEKRLDVAKQMRDLYKLALAGAMDTPKGPTNPSTEGETGS